jgi:hypothetical protein
MSFQITPLTVSIREGRADTLSPSATDLRKAAAAYREAGKNNSADTCEDIAAKIARFGSYASAKQQDFARSLVGNATAVKSPFAPPVAEALRVPSLFEVMQRLADVTLPTLKIARKNQDSLCWLIDNNGDDTCIGKIENGTVTLFAGRMARIGVKAADVLALLRQIEADPIKAIADAGRASGRCAICSRDLTDEESIARGIGPVCAGKLFA